MKFAMVFASFIMMAAVGPTSAQEVLDGTWKLISSKRTTVATSATVDTFGPDPQGYIMYGKDGRMMVLSEKRSAKTGKH